MEAGAAPGLTQVHEDVVELEQRNLDHHPLWPPGGAVPFGLEEFLRADTADRHRVEATRFTKCGAVHRGSGPITSAARPARCPAP